MLYEPIATVKIIRQNETSYDGIIANDFEEISEKEFQIKFYFRKKWGYEERKYEDIRLGWNGVDLGDETDFQVGNLYDISLRPKLRE